MDVIRVGTFELHPSERRLCAAGQPVELGARAFDLLLVLVENPGRLVTKATLLERVWPRLVVDENNLPAQVASLRRVLGVGAIRTVPGFGYRLELDVSSAATSPAAVTPAADAAPRLSVPRRAWPDRLGPLIGREDDVGRVRDALAAAPLVTLVGAAGVGKTRLAQEVFVREAEQPGTAVAWVALGSTGDVSNVAPAIALALGLALPDSSDGFESLRHALQRLPVLLILDGVEQLAGELATPLAMLVAQTEGVRALVTSQAPLGVRGEIVYRIAGLSVPVADAPVSDAAHHAAVALFAQRARAADQRFELSAANIGTVAQICRRLDGIPLALELAAARVPALGLGGLLERLDDRFRLLKLAGRPADPRHGALHTAFDWSYGLLAPAEQRVFDRLGAFAGSFSLNAAARCVADEQIDTAEAIDLIGRLVDRSLVTALPVEPPRYTLLETARYYALDRLVAGNGVDAARRRMAETVLAVLDVAYQEYWSVDEAIWLNRYEPELDNVRAALDWAALHDRALSVGLYGSAWPLFVETDLYAEGRARYAQVVALLCGTLPRSRTGRFWEAIATYDSTRQCDRARHAAELACGAHADARDDRGQYYALMQLAFDGRADAEAARSAYEKARALEDPAWPARLLAHGALTEGALYMSLGQLAEARAAYQRAVKLALTISERRALAATAHLVELDLAGGDMAAALQLGRPLVTSLRHSGRRETRFAVLALTFGALLLAGARDEARSIGAELLDVALRLDPSLLYTVLDAMAFLACEDGRVDEAARVAACSTVAHEARGQAPRGPAEARVRAEVEARLAGKLGTGWLAAARASRESLDETSACLLALGLRT